MKMKKRTLSAILLSPVFFVVIVYALLISPLGGPAVKLIANAFVANLSIKQIEGGFAGPLTITQVNWENPQWRVEVGRVYADVTWRCAFEPRVCINNLEVENATVTQLKAAADEGTEEQNETFALPIPVDAAQLSLQNIEVETLSAQVSVDTLLLEDFSGATRIKFDTLEINGVAIALNEARDTSEARGTTAKNRSDSDSKTVEQNSATLDAQIPTSYSLNYTVPELPIIVTPIPVEFGAVRINALRFSQGDIEQRLLALSLTDTTFQHSALRIESFDVKHEKGQVSGFIDADLKGNYPLDIDLTGYALIASQRQNIELNATGALDDIALSLNASGIITASTSLSTNLLSESLPINFDANWQKQSIPTLEGATLDAGQISVNGTMGDYKVLGSGSANLPDIGEIPVALNVVLKKNNIYVHEADISALEGNIKNTGTLYLNDTVAWQGKTTLTNVSAQQFNEYAPTELRGSIESILQYSERGGLHVSLRDIDIAGELQDEPLRLVGEAVYAGPSDLLVTNVNIEQSENRIKAVAQVLNKRHLNANIDIDIASINALYTEASGAIKGNIQASGPWQNPSTTSTLNLSNVSVSPNLNKQAAEQGPLNGDVSITGTYESHNADIDLTLPEHAVKVALSGAWKNNLWKGNISETQLHIANMRWLLSSPFNFEVGTAPLTAKISSHCWSSRGEGELCIDNVNYQENKATWDITASSLPVGLWANELAPSVVSKASSASLTVKSKGSYSKADPIDATFTASLSSSQWQLGETRPITLTINSVETSGNIKQGKLTSTSLIVSEDIGDATLKLDTRPFDDRKPLEGTLSMEGIDVSPFKPISPAIRTLTGLLNGEIALKGYLDDPLLNGELNIKNGAIDIQDTPVSLSDWSQSIVLNGQVARLDGTFTLGGGEGALTGELDWSANPSAKFSLKGDGFEIRQPNTRLKVSPNLDVVATKEKIDISGDVNIPWARIEIASLPDSAVSPSKDVHLRGEPRKEEPLDIVHASVMVHIDQAKTEEVKVEAFGLTASLYGGIRINTQPALVGYGDLQILNGRYVAYGQNLIIQTGEIQFNGPIGQPSLLVEAIRNPAKTDDDVIAGIRIDGSADSPSINLFSEPAMDQQGVLSYLLTGSGPNSGASDPNYAALLLGFGLSNTKTLTGQVGSVLGIDDFSLSTNEDMLSLTGQINDRLSVEYNVDVGLGNNDVNSTLRRRQLPPDLALKYQLLPNLYLEAIQTTLEDQSEFALDLYYEFFLGENRRRFESDDEQNDKEIND